MDPVEMVEAMVAEGCPFEVIESRIEALGMPEDMKAALWLLAWASTEPGTRRRVVRELVYSTP